MTQKQPAAAAVTLLLFQIAVPVAAHHSHANYAQRDWVELQGRVTKVHWLNPHVWIFLEVQDANGNTVQWSMEGGSVAALTDSGWQRDSIKVGDRISARCMPLKDRSPGCLLGYVTTNEFQDKEFD